MHSVGSKAPDFTLKSKQASGLVDVKLSNGFGKKNTVLLFFPRPSPVFARRKCATHRRPERLHRPQCDVIAVSVDTPFAQEAWAQKEKINLTLASDLNKEVIKNMMLYSDARRRWRHRRARAFVIDKNGVVQYSEQTPTPKDLPNFAKVKETLARLK